MSTPGALPIPTPYLPDFAKNFDDPKTRLDFLQSLQDGFDAIRLQIGNNADTVAAAALMGLYSGTWAPYTATGGFTPYYMKKAGMVTLGGAVTNNSTFSTGTIMTMPVGFRPASTEQFAQVAVGGAGGAPTSGIAIVQVVPAGTVSFISGVTGGGLTNNMEYISLSGITYGAAA